MPLDSELLNSLPRHVKFAGFDNPSGCWWELDYPRTHKNIEIYILYVNNSATLCRILPSFCGVILPFCLAKLASNYSAIHTRTHTHMTALDAAGCGKNTARVLELESCITQGWDTNVLN
jgi:hypothetical protein